MSQFKDKIIEGYQPKCMKASKIYPSTEKGKNYVGFNIDLDECNEFITQLLIARQFAEHNGLKSVHVRAYRSNNELLIKLDDIKKGDQTS